MRRFLAGVLVGIVLTIGSGIAAFVLLGSWLAVEDPLAKVDAIVAISGDSGARAETAIALWKQGYAPAIVFSGAALDPESVSSAEIMRREAIRQGLKDGTIDVIATDHAPHHYDAKEREFDDAPNGIIGLETALGLAITELVTTRLLPLPELVARMSTIPAKIFGLPGGTLAPGAPADVVVFDPAVEWTVRPQEFFSRSRNTPFAGRRLTGRASVTIVRGQVVFQRPD